MMEKPDELTVLLNDTEKCAEKNVGGKGAKLSHLIAEGYRVPGGFCLTTGAYRLFIETAKIDAEIKVELGRKSLGNMRWEEIWDAALRIRSFFLRSEIPGLITAAVREKYDSMPSSGSWVVRSSAPGEDSAGLSFAGLHESIVNVNSFDELIKSIRIVWASLWSDAALLYRKEMRLDPDKSAMAVVIQEFLEGGPSGVAFSRDPRNIKLDQAIIEAVPGSNNELVDGLVEPDRWIVARNSRKIIDWRQGSRGDQQETDALLSNDELLNLYDNILTVESKLGWAVDVEWTGRGEELSLLQARPITSGNIEAEDDRRGWYLSLRPKLQILKKLAWRVNDELLPRLRKEGERLSHQKIQNLNDRELAEVIKERLAILKKWRKIYYDEFIPLAHGVRQLGVYYNNEVKPENPYEFMVLLEGQDLLASKRNQLLDELARLVVADERLKRFLETYLGETDADRSDDWPDAKKKLQDNPSGHDFVKAFEKLEDNYTHVSYKGANLANSPRVYLHSILELAGARSAGRQKKTSPGDKNAGPDHLEKKLLDAVGEKRRSEALEIIELGRLSWKLRDDDNILVGRLESLLLEALDLAGQRMIKKGKLDRYEKLNDTAALILAEALLYPPDEPIELPKEMLEDTSALRKNQGKPRQLVGQPAGPGTASGSARVVRDIDDLKHFKFGEVLVCDAIQPTMTHIVPLACAIVERRGGMLIHGAIIARELGLPCVNGVAEAAELIQDGEMVTVDGYLGIVTVGEPEFNLEKTGEVAKPAGS